MINIASPVIEEEERRAVNEVIESGMLAQGPKVAELEESWAKYCGVKHALAVNSGTAAIHCALYAAGVGEGYDQPYTNVGRSTSSCRYR